MSRFLTVSQSAKIKGIQGLTESLTDISRRLPDAQCPLLKTQLEDIEKLSKALSIMASKVNVES